MLLGSGKVFLHLNRTKTNTGEQTLTR